jgi:hypothetical protein
VRRQLFFPLGLAANIFSTQGVLPFTPNFARFTYLLFVLSVVVMMTLIISFNWTSWLQSIVQRFRPTFFRSSTPSGEDLETGLLSPTEIPNFRSRMKPKHAATWSLRDLMNFSYSPLSARDGEQHDLDGRLDPRSPTVNLAAETNPPSLHFSRVHTPIRKRSSFTPFTSISNVLKRLLRPTPEADKQRIEWTCVSRTKPDISSHIIS